jgi:hypothetical protein
MSRPTSANLGAGLLPPCEGRGRRAGSGGRAACVAAREGAPPHGERDGGRVARVTPSAMPVALDGAWRVGEVERGWRSPLSAPEPPRRGAERGPLTRAERLAPPQGAGEESTAARQPNRPAKRHAGRGATERRDVSGTVAS